jgi:hypothetical protein
MFKIMACIKRLGTLGMMLHIVYHCLSRYGDLHRPSLNCHSINHMEEPCMIMPSGCLLPNETDFTGWCISTFAVVHSIDTVN